MATKNAPAKGKKAGPKKDKAEAKPEPKGAEKQETVLGEEAAQKPMLFVGQDGRAEELTVAQVRERAQATRSEIKTSYIVMAQYLHAIHANALYMDWGYNDGFDKYVEQELEFAKRKAMYLVSIWEYFGVKFAHLILVPKVRDLGWSKASLIADKDLLTSDDEAKTWVEKAKPLSVRELKAEVSRAKLMKQGKDPDKKDDDDGDEKAKRKTFSLFPAQMANVEAAVKAAKQQAKSDKEGHCLDAICVSYLAMTDTSTPAAAFEGLLRHIENTHGVRLVAYNVKKKAVTFGLDTIDMLAGQAPEPAEKKE